MVHISYICETCKVEFQRRKNGKSFRFCSRRCMGQYARNNYFGGLEQRHDWDERIKLLRSQGLSSYEIHAELQSEGATISRATVGRRIYGTTIAVQPKSPRPALTNGHKRVLVRHIKPRAEKTAAQKSILERQPSNVGISNTVTMLDSEIKSKAAAFLRFRSRLRG